MLDFIVQQQFWFRTALDLGLVLLILYWIFKVMRGTKGIYFMNGIILLFLIFIASRYLHLTLFSQVLNQLILMLMVAVPIIFQSELKRGLETLGRKNPIVKWFIKVPAIAAKSIAMVAEAAEQLSQKRIGALIVFERGNPLPVVTQSGSYIDAVLSKILIEQFFYPNSPLHDGAVLIRENRIQAAGCFLPLDNEIALPQELGSRHRAGLSLASQSDALVVIISEETGRISLAYHGLLESGYTRETLQSKLEELTHVSDKGPVAAGETVQSEVD
jgi:diadenylate cyclase